MKKAVWATHHLTRQSNEAHRDFQLLADQLISLAGVAALLLFAVPLSLGVANTTVTQTKHDGALALGTPSTSEAAKESRNLLSWAQSNLAHHGWTVGAYGGVADTLNSTVRIVNPGRTDVTVSDFPWIGKPFRAPPYYGVRIQRWSNGLFGGMLDFTHGKAIGKTDATGTFKGTHNGKALPEKAPMTDVFSSFEFSHGHNMLTINGMLRGLPLLGFVRPYVGAGAGVSLPHTEIGFKGDNARTYEYQYAGLVGQALVGLEWRIGPVTIFTEYKYSYAPYDVPLSQTYQGHLLVTDLWRQFMAWYTGENPPGGRLSTVLQTHHGIAGVMYNVPNPLRAGR